MHINQDFERFCLCFILFICQNSYKLSFEEHALITDFIIFTLYDSFCFTRRIFVTELHKFENRVFETESR